MAKLITEYIEDSSVTPVKISPLTNNRVVVTDGTGLITQSVTTDTELTYVSGVTSALQTQLNATEKTANKGAVNGYASLDGGGHIPLSQLPATLVEYQGTWDASTNTPTLSNASGIYNVSGFFFITSTGGTVNFGTGAITFNSGDWVLFNGTVWQRAVQSNIVQSVNGQTGIVTVNAINQLTSDITAGPASGSASAAATVTKIQGTTVSGTTGSGNVVFSTSPTLTGTVVATNIAASGTVTGSNLSGTNTGDQTITLTGDINGSGTGSFAATIQPNVVSNSKLAQIPAHSYKGNNTGSTANTADITSTQLTADLNLFTSSLQGLVPASGGGTTNFLRADGAFATPPSSGGSVTSVALTDSTGIFNISGSPITTSGTLSLASLQSQSANTFLAAPNGSSGAPTFRSIVATDIPTLNQNTTGNAATVTTNANLTGPVTSVGNATSVTTNAITNTMLAQMPTLTIKGNNTGSTANASDLTVSQVNTILGDILANGTVAMSASLNLGTNQIINVVDPTTAQMAATKNYVDNALAQLNPKTSVVAATVGSNIVGTYLNGIGGIGATFTTTATGTFTVDGYTPALGDRILIKDQTSGFQNGVYNITTLGSLGVSTVFTRALDYDQPSDINGSGAIPIINGTVNNGTSYLQTATVTTIGTDPLIFILWTKNPSSYVTAITGDLVLTTYTGLVNNTANQNITGFAFANATVRSFEAQVSLTITATSNLYAVYNVQGVQRASDWVVSFTGTGDAVTGVNFHSTNAGQIQVDLGNIAGFSSSKIAFRAQVTQV